MFNFPIAVGLLFCINAVCLLNGVFFVVILSAEAEAAFSFGPETLSKTRPLTRRRNVALLIYHHHRRKT